MKKPWAALTDCGRLRDVMTPDALSAFLRDPDALVKLAEKSDRVIRMKRSTGEQTTLGDLRRATPWGIGLLRKVFAALSARLRGCHDPVGR